ncbi:MAG: FAD:protein FMN transferase [Chloroflexi bacterium]|nr:FAD:protein FMN transferase [Chloroflexota bacterium]
MREVHRVTTVAMDTWVTVQVVSVEPPERVDAVARRALGWFAAVERACSRFEPDSEVMRLALQAGRPVQVSPLLLEVVAFALELARLTDGAFDPTVGGVLEQHGFDRSYRTGATSASGVGEGPASYRDVRVDRRTGSITLRRALVLDLGAVAKGLAIDLAAQELHAYHDFSVEAGGDLYVHGRNAAGESWHVGIQHPRAEGLIVRTIAVTDAAICTSGDYERRAPDGTPHILDARTGRSPTEEPLVSVSVLAPTALAADGLSTAAMLLGRERGLRLLEQHGVAGLLLLPDCTICTTPGEFGEPA